MQNASKIRLLSILLDFNTGYKAKMEIIERISSTFESYLMEAKDWAKGRFPFFRLILLIVFLYAWYRHIQEPTYGGIFFGLNFGLHELGHFIFAPFGEFMMILGGSLFQCLVPFIGIIMFLKQNDHFGVAFCFGWEATNLYYVATYIADARAMALPLLTPFGVEAYHDWNYILSRTGLLRYDTFIAWLVRIIASICMIICLVYGGWLIGIMFKSFKKNWTSI